MYKYLLLIILMIGGTQSLLSQNSEEKDGVISYITNQNVYVRFDSTVDIEAGDTIFKNVDGAMIPLMIIANLSSISAVCKPIGNYDLEVNQKVSVKINKSKSDNYKGVSSDARKSDSQNKQLQQTEVINTEDTNKQKKVQKEDAEIKEVVEKKFSVSGRLTASSYLNLSDTPMGNGVNNRYTFRIQTDNQNVVVGANMYLSFVNSTSNREKLKQDIFNGLKIYDMSVWIKPISNMKITLGREINPLIPSVGAIDGIQIEQKVSDFSIGAYVGSRPDSYNYGYNIKLFQSGAFVSHNKVLEKGGIMQSVLAFAQQQNNGNTDRRFLYFQHYNSLLKNLYLLVNGEVELYQNINDTVTHTPKLTSTFISVRYRFSRKMVASASFRTQGNRLYYYTYRDYITNLSNDQNIVGLRFGISLLPIKHLTLGLKAGYSNGTMDLKSTTNFSGYVSYRKIPFLKNVVFNGGYTYLETSFISGSTYMAGLTRDFFRGKLVGSLGYRFVNYSYPNSSLRTKQNVAEADISWRISDMFMANVSFEGTYFDNYNNNKIYASLSMRF